MTIRMKRNFMKKNYYLLGFFLLVIQIGLAQTKPMVQATIDTTNIRIGEQFNYKISVNETENVIFLNYP